MVFNLQCMFATFFSIWPELPVFVVVVVVFAYHVMV